MMTEQSHDLTPQEDAAFDREDAAGFRNALFARGEEESGLASKKRGALPGQAIHYDKPSGRSAEGIGGSDISRMFANEDGETNPIAPDKKAEIRRSLGHSSFLIEKERLAYDNMLRHTEDDPRARAVALRNLAEGRKWDYTSKHRNS